MGNNTFPIFTSLSTEKVIYLSNTTTASLYQVCIQSTNRHTSLRYSCSPWYPLWIDGQYCRIVCWCGQMCNLNEHMTADVFGDSLTAPNIICSFVATCLIFVSYPAMLMIILALYRVYDFFLFVNRLYSNATRMEVGTLTRHISKWRPQERFSIKKNQLHFIVLPWISHTYIYFYNFVFAYDGNISELFPLHYT